MSSTPSGTAASHDLAQPLTQLATADNVSTGGTSTATGTGPSSNESRQQRSDCGNDGTGPNLGTSQNKGSCRELVNVTVDVHNHDNGGQTTEYSVGDQKKKVNITLWICFTIFVTFRAADRIFLKDIVNALERSSYNLIWANVIWPILIQMMTICMIFGYVAYQRSQGDLTYDWRFFLPGNPKASSSGKPVPMLQLALFSLGDQINAAMSAPPSPFVTLPVQSVMTNMVIVYTAVVAFYWLQTRYRQVHLIGILLIVVSILVQFGPAITGNDCSAEGLEKGKCFASYKNTQGVFVELTTSSMISWYVLFGVSFLPAAVGNVYKQKVLQGHDVDVWYATWWAGNWQIVWGFCCIPLMWIPLPGQPKTVPATFFEDLRDTLRCIGGGVPRPGDETCATSPPPWFFGIFYFSFNLSFNICLLYLTKAMSANWAQIATVLCLNLCSFFSQFSFLMGNAAQTMGYFDYMALALASIALWTYNLEKEVVPLDQIEEMIEKRLSTNGDISQTHRNSVVQIAKQRSSLGMLTASMVADGPAGKALLTNSFQAGPGNGTGLNASSSMDLLSQGGASQSLSAEAAADSILRRRSEEKLRTSQV